jgi:hypothetical protein
LKVTTVTNIFTNFENFFCKINEVTHRLSRLWLVSVSVNNDYLQIFCCLRKDRKTERQKGRKTKRQKDRKKERNKERKARRQTDRQTESHKEDRKTVDKKGIFVSA